MYDVAVLVLYVLRGVYVSVTDLCLAAYLYKSHPCVLNVNCNGKHSSVTCDVSLSPSKHCNACYTLPLPL
jgi:hypothetical protein